MMGRYVISNFNTNSKYEIRNGRKAKEAFSEVLGSSETTISCFLNSLRKIGFIICFGTPLVPVAAYGSVLQARGDWLIPNPLLVKDREINKMPICCSKECIPDWHTPSLLRRQWQKAAWNSQQAGFGSPVWQPFCRSRGCSLIATISLERASSPVSKQLKSRAYNGFVAFVLGLGFFFCLIDFIFFLTDAYIKSILNRGSESLLVE